MLTYTRGPNFTPDANFAPQALPGSGTRSHGCYRRWERARAAAVIGECGTGKTLIALAAIHCHAEGKPYTALALVPGHLTLKMA